MSLGTEPLEIPLASPLTCWAFKGSQGRFGGAPHLTRAALPGALDFLFYAYNGAFPIIEFVMKLAFIGRANSCRCFGDYTILMHFTRGSPTGSGPRLEASPEWRHNQITPGGAQTSWSSA